MLTCMRHKVSDSSRLRTDLVLNPKYLFYGIVMATKYDSPPLRILYKSVHLHCDNDVRLCFLRRSPHDRMLATFVRRRVRDH